MALLPEINQVQHLETLRDMHERGWVVYPIERRVNDDLWIDCLDWDDESGSTQATVHRFEVSPYLPDHLTGGTHLLVCERCGMHLHADFEVVP
jgi:hypothetical protein